MDIPSEFLFRLRRELNAFRLRIEDLSDAIRKHSETIRSANESNGPEKPPTRGVRAIVSPDDKMARDAQKEHDRQYGVQNSIRWATWLAVIGAFVYAGIAAKQLRLTRQIWTNEQKAYVILGRADGTAAEIVWPKNGDGNAGILVYFQNAGHVPARFNWGADYSPVGVPSDPTVIDWNNRKGGWIILPVTRPFEPMYRAKSRKTGGVQSSGTVDIAGGSSYQGIFWEFPKQRMSQLIEANRPLDFSGKFEYCDGFGKRVCNRFTIIYAKAPYNHFFIGDEDECSAWEMQVLHPLPDFDYLPPCSLAPREDLLRTNPTLPKP